MEIRLPPMEKWLNSSFVPLFHNKDRYLLLYGGRGSSKSNFAAKKLIYRCLNERYFRYILVRDTYTSIKDSQYQTIKDIVNEWGLSSLFRFKENPLEIKCINGNIFYARGCDNVETIKSIKDPTGAWYEEGNEIKESDFITITTSIRTSKASYLQEIFSFNPECEGNPDDFWINKMFFKGNNDKSFSSNLEITLPNGKVLQTAYTAHHSTYHDNRWITNGFIAFLEQLKKLAPYYYEVFCLGIWGHKQINKPFAYAFDDKKHVGRVEYNSEKELLLGFDFNVDPVVAIAAQLYDDKLEYIKEFTLENSDIYELCDRIKTAYPHGLFLVTGDASGHNRSALAKGNINYYTVIQDQLGLSDGQMKQPSINPHVKDRRVLLNSVLQNFNVIFDEENCPKLIRDMKYVEVDDKGEIKKDRSSDVKKADHLDAGSYLICTFMDWFLNLKYSE